MYLVCRYDQTCIETVLTQPVIAHHDIVPYVLPDYGSVESFRKFSHRPSIGNETDSNEDNDQIPSAIGLIRNRDIR